MSTAASFTRALDERVLLCDGAMGTLAAAGGVRAEGPGTELCLVAPELVASLHRRYLDAGADVIETHTYGATRHRLARSGLAERTAEINRAGAALAVAARDDRPPGSRPVWVAGSVSPASLPPTGTPSRARTGVDRRAPGPRERDDAVREQVEALVAGGVDLVLLETFTEGEELARAVVTVREVTDLPVVAQATFLADEPWPLTAAGEDPAAVLARLRDAGALDLAAVGTNCTLGPQGLLTVLRGMREHTAVPLAAQPNAGLPHVTGDRGVRFAADADHFARYVRRYVAAGARLVGGCCGTTPEHTAAARAVLDGPAPGADAPAPTEDPPPAGTPPVRSRLVVDRRAGGDRATRGPRPAATRGNGAARGTSGGVRRWLDPGGSPRPFLVGADVAVSGAVADNVTRARAVAAAADVLWIGRSRTRRSPTSPAGLAVAVAEQVDVDVAVTMTGWGAGPLALQADLLGLHALGVRTVVCETASPPVHAEQPVRESGWEPDAVSLLRLAAGLDDGVDGPGPAATSGAVALALGARFSPAAPLESEARRVAAEVAAGARFLVSYPVFELDRARTLLAAVRELTGRPALPALLTVAPPRDFAHAEYLAHEVPDVVVGEAVLERLRREGPEAGPAVGAEVAAAAVGVADGVVVRWSGPDPASVLERVRASVAAARR